MKMKINQNKLVMGFTLIVGSLFSLVAGQYYYFDAGGSTYQQWCSETLALKATTEANVIWAKAWLLRLQLDPVHFRYYSWTDAAGLQSNLFQASAATFLNYTNPTLSPSWIDLNTTILHIDRYNNGSNFVGNWLYGTLLLSPTYSPIDYTGTVSIVYNGDTVRTTLSYWGTNIINPWYQYAHLTGYYYVYQLPCSLDSIAPGITIPVPASSIRQSSLSGIQLILTENIWNAWPTEVPYVRTGGLPGSGGIWTGNSWSLNNQYGVNFSTFQIHISGNGTGRYFTGGMFLPSGTLSAIASNKTWQFNDRDYTVYISWTKLFYYGIEQPITITGNVYDRYGNFSSFSRTLNTPIGPWLIPGSDIPAWGAVWILTTAPVKLGIMDDWAGVNSWTIIITLSGIGWTTYGPYTFTWTALNLSGVQWTANQPDYYITISSQIAFPSSWTIQVSVSAQDMEWNPDTIGDYSFETKPSCADLGCCDNISIQTGENPAVIYSGFTLNVSGGIDPSFTIDGNTGTLDCGTENQMGLNIYKWVENFSWNATYVTFFDLPTLFLSWDISVKAVLSGQTITLQASNIFSFSIKAFPSNRVYQDVNNANIWILKFYDMNKNFVASSSPFNLNALWTGTITVNIWSGTYYAVFKWQSHLASYLSGIQIIIWTWNVFDFTTGTNLYGTQNLDSATDDGKQYQTAWDLKNTNGDYDYVINGNDVSIMLYDTFPQLWVSILEPRNLNGDTAINASDISVIGTNFMKQDDFAADGGIFQRQ